MDTKILQSAQNEPLAGRVLAVENNQPAVSVELDSPSPANLGGFASPESKSQDQIHTHSRFLLLIDEFFLNL
ncbi:MAG TPA: hypothetical protein VFA85_00350 [Terriglobales bacterium]|nr:hypothetical protein [Terriglobales bacterium]